jgi:hypothetical protein
VGQGSCDLWRGCDEERRLLMNGDSRPLFGGSGITGGRRGRKGRDGGRIGIVGRLRGGRAIGGGVCC